MSVIHAPEERPLHVRLLLVPGALVAVMLAYLCRLWYLQVLDAQRNLFASQLALARLKLAELQSVTQLYRALGGGWR